MTIDDQAESGVLYLVATPVGNLDDITQRAIDTLKTVDIVAAEDTRHSRILFSRHEITVNRLESYHAHNLDSRTGHLVRQLLDGKSVALISDAGTPGISDPGSALARAAVEAGITVCPIPGASAPMLALTASGFPTHRFVYEGFLPRKKGRKTLIDSWKDEPRTVVFFESGLRLVKTLEQISAALGPRKVCVAREMTKKFEEFLRGDIGEVIEELSRRGGVKGEVTVVLAPAGYLIEKSQ
ncbi:MAG: 16S rRNA (cytidine(1402)-2'-O)-methyltransferase [Nitrospinota bacterium]|nr:16S rRNA (cytidine(1402)-2'-O)-methyltransferase [Nitrospinota bacterium]